MTERTTHGPIYLVTSTGEPFDVDLTGFGDFTGRTSRSGLAVLRFPAPFDDIEFTPGERIGPKKLARIRAACAALRGQET